MFGLRDDVERVSRDQHNRQQTDFRIFLHHGKDQDRKQRENRSARRQPVNTINQIESVCDANDPQGLAQTRQLIIRANVFDPNGNPVPAPGSLALLLAAGIAGLIARRRRGC